MPDEENPHVRIGRLRWPVTLVRRVQTPAGVGIVETAADPVVVNADVQAVGGLTFWATGGYEQIDTPITHRIYMRWHDYQDQTQAILRTTKRPDGTYRTETFRVRRVKELGGRKRSVMIEAELEQTTNLPQTLVTGNSQIVLQDENEAYTGTIIGDGVTASFTVMHNLGTTDVIVQVRDTTDQHANLTQVDNTAPTPNTVTIVFDDPPAVGAAMRVLVIAV